MLPIDSEGVNLAPDTLDTILRVSRGDMRKAVTFLQSSHQISPDSSQPVRPEAVVDLSGQVPDSIMESLWGAMAGHSFDAVRTTVEDVIFDGYPLSAVLLQLHEMVALEKAELRDVDRALICEKLAQADQQLADGANEMLQLLDVAAFVMRRISNAAAEVDGLSGSGLH